MRISGTVNLMMLRKIGPLVMSIVADDLRPETGFKREALPFHDLRNGAGTDIFVGFPREMKVGLDKRVILYVKISRRGNYKVIIKYPRRGMICNYSTPFGFIFQVVF